MELLDGKKTSSTIRDEIKAKVSIRKAEGKKIPHLAAVIVGENGASLTYVNAKVKACEYVGFESTLVQLPADISEADLLNKITALNADENIDGYIVQLPLPKHINELKITQAISPLKDVDGFHPENIGKMVLDIPGFLPATPYGIVQLLDRYHIETSGKHCVVVGRSHIVGSPMSILMSRNNKVGNSTVTLTHSRTKNLEEITRTADILIVALGKTEFITGDMVKEGVVVVDVGITRVSDDSKKSGFRLLGDVKFDEVAKKASYITPVPGGVGPMTIASLLMNTLSAVEK
ncbi:bifunctional 5,10-methylene-tetrahydrofolate dehydrogenase/5,10-methylene-tetrahydrofolate cyclohydrolase [Putridiphycobacter roseus]|uniref:Bifunctional protein FolD n=1 Tax=Putridiphycobacter roseus TaxID=2219161 RepID=A0A2W1NF42_9FLAO|nr:tetrahydrofolate dehydrogenase/cyclohydrolase catalytic domain-containing protein [Putridiphycobacter roseus]PZE17723.1 bifunctional 5,10-methylene-tetrahydrofolate dehydrogenase/5,10-methylene-tetrahydrofolate cyclohydrolase [Putridiphycobacter roseus]